MVKIEQIVRSATAPTDGRVLWLNSEDDCLYVLKDTGWVSISGGGGMSEEGTSGNIPAIGEDGVTLVDSLISASELSAIVSLIGSWDSATVAKVNEASLLSKYLNIILGYTEMPVFSNATPYAVGDVCLKDNVMYRFTSAHSGSWNDADVVVTNFYKEFVRYYSGASDNETVNVQLIFDSTAPSFTGKYITVNYGTSSTTDVALDNTGAATFTMAKSTQYTIVFPSFEGYNNVSNKNFTAYLEQRPVEATYYHQAASATDEEVTVITSFTNTSSSKPSGSITVEDTTADKTQTYTLDSDGKATFSITLGHSYTIEFPGVSNYITPVTKSFTASLPRRTVESKYAPLVSGMFLMDASLNQYTFDEWVASGKSGSEAKYLFCSSATLSQNGANFFINLDDIRSTGSTPGKQWLSAQVQVSTIPFKANYAAASADFGVVAYDSSVPGSGPISNQIALQSWIDDQAQEGNTYTSQLLQYVATKDLTINSTTYKAYVGTAGQWDYLSTGQNYGTFKRIMQYLATGDGDDTIKDTTMPADPNWVNKTFWTMSQVSATGSWDLYYGSLNYNGSTTKTYSSSVLCFYAL